MFRYAQNDLLNWFQKKDKSPLLIRGARQVGKTYLVETLGPQHFDHLVMINFEFMPEFLTCFSTLDPHEILRKLSLIRGQEISPHKTLLFLDEIQQCPEAILALRYFKEKMPEIAVIAAGSLLEFTLNDPKFCMPVGRVEFMHLYPLSFKEFLLAIDEKTLVHWIENFQLKDIDDPISSVLHERCLKRLREYCAVGGMPEVVKQYAKNPADFEEVQNLQNKLLQGYLLDFGKYARTNIQHKNLQSIFEKLPLNIAKQIKYSHFNPDIPSRDIKLSLEMLKLAGLCHFVLGSSGAGIPMGAMVNEKKLKLLHIDIGLYIRALYLDPKKILLENSNLINDGVISEQLAGQELLVKRPYFEKGQLYFWARDTAGSEAEVDYLWQLHDKVIPIEVKSGASGWLKSLNLFKQTYHSPLGIRLSSRPLHLDESTNLWSIPLYLISELDRLITG